MAEVDLRALIANFHALSALAPSAAKMAILKADAYGHGAVEVGRALAAEGCRHFGVATVGEARQLRAAGIDHRVYVMAGFFAEQADEIVELDLTPFVIDDITLRAIAEASKAHGRAAFPIHLKLDTGASRLGMTLDALDSAVELLRDNRWLNVEGACTLLANAGEPTSPGTNLQLRRFDEAVEILRAAGITLRYRHVANSAATALRPDSHLDMVRLGLALYGLPPVPAVREHVTLIPVMTFRTRLMQVKQVPAGTGVSYGFTFVTQRPSVIGVLPLGYADGYRRGLQHGGEVLIRGRRAPVIGAVCMDLTVIDLTDVPGATVGDTVILWGALDNQAISVNDVARLVQTISYEMLCTVGRRVPRVYRS